MGLNENLSIDLARRGAIHIPAKQDDRGYLIILTIKDNGVNIVDHATDTAKFRLSKADHTIYYGDAVVNNDDTVSVPIDTDGQMLAVPGYATMDVTIFQGTVVKSTQNFILDIQAAPGGEAIPSTSVFIELQELVDDANGKILDAEAWAVGTRNGIPVDEGDPAFENNAKYYAGEAADDAQAAQGYASNAHDDAQDAHADMLAAQDAAEAAGIAQGHAEDAQEAAEDAAEDAQESAQEAAQAAVEALWAYLPQDSASGPIANFPDGASDVPVDGLVISAEPIQDLHGYANPWPAGGGTNKCSVDSYTLSKPDNRTKSLYIDTIPAGEYTISWKSGTSAETRMQGFDANNNSLFGTITTTATGSRTVTISADCVRLYVYIASTEPDGATASITDLQIEQGSSYTGYKPYSNLCPISGRTGGSLVRTGANVWDEEWESGAISTTTGEPTTSSSTIRSINFSPCVPDSSYYGCAPNSPSSFAVFFYDSDKNYIGYLATSAVRNKVFATPSNARFFKTYFTSSTYNHDISINYPSTDHDYHAYSGITIPITFPTAAGTVYGGKVDVTRGKLSVDRKRVVFNGNSSSTDVSVGYATGNACCRVTYSPYASEGIITTNAKGFVSNALADYGRYSGTLQTPWLIYCSSSAPRMWMSMPGDIVNSLESFNAYTTQNPIEVVYPLATPIEYDFDPTELRTLLGTNNVWSDIGDVSVAYRADVQKYIQKLVAQALNA